MLYRSITGGRSPHTEGFHHALRELRAQVPTVTDLAARLGFPRRTVGDWLNKGSMPRGARADEARQSVLEALRRHRLRLGRERRLRAGRVTILVKQRYDDGRPTGQDRVWKHPHSAQSDGRIDWRGARANGAIIDAYLDGDMRGAAEAFIAGIGDPEYQDMTSPENADEEVHFDIYGIELE
jgi:hypothetical protein